jgi:hypothetical protein
MTADEARKIAESHPPEELTLNFLGCIITAANDRRRRVWFEKMPIEVQLDLARMGYKVQAFPKGFEVRW